MTEDRLAGLANLLIHRDIYLCRENIMRKFDEAKQPKKHAENYFDMRLVTLFSTSRQLWGNYIYYKRLLIWQLFVSKACISYMLYGFYMHI
jgi:hypothetical protein